MIGVLIAAREGIAAVEFALVGTLLAILMLGLYDLSKAYIIWRQLTQAAQSIGEIATRIAVQQDGTNILTYQNALIASSAIFPIVPATQTMAPSTYGVAMTAVVFTPPAPTCKTNCQYIGKPTWAAKLQGSQPVRPCGALKQVSDTAPSGPTTLPADAFQASSLLVIDVSATYNPLFLTFVTGPVRLLRSAYLPPRSGTLADWIRMSVPANLPAGTVTNCP